MASIDDLVKQFRQTSGDVRFADLCKVCNHYFGEPRQKGTSHRVYKMPWRGDPRVNIQKDGNKAKQYQVKQVLEAIDKLKEPKK